MALVLPALLCMASGLALVSIGWWRRVRLAADMPLRASIAVGYGIGVFSVVFFVARVGGTVNLLALDLLVLALLLAVVFLARNFLRRNSAVLTVPPVRGQLEPPLWLDRILTAAYAIALCAAIYSAVMRTLAHPYGDGWDAFAIWNLHARFLFRAGTHWRDGFSALIPWSHPDYPLLLPAAVAHFWTCLGHDDPRVPAVISFLFTFSTVTLLFSALSILRGRTAAMMGALALLTTPFFVEQGTSQYADVPLSFFVLATVAILCLHDYDSANGSPSPGLLLQAGLAAGFAAWTKNEGLLFLCAILVARFLILIYDKSRRDPSRPFAQTASENWIALVVLVASVAPVLILIGWFKHSVVPASDLFSDPATTFHKLLDPKRYWAILQWYAKGFLRFGHWLLIPGTLVLIGFYCAAGAKESRELEPGFRCARLALILTLAGYFAVYLITPYDIYWHLRFSLTRLFLQLWPSMIFLFFLAVELPQKNA